MRDVCAVIVAGGSGTRFGNPGGKLLVDAAGKPLMTWSLQAFDACQSVGAIVVVCPDSEREHIRATAIDPYELATPVSFAVSGELRQDSSRAGVRAVPAFCSLVAIHDAARPLILPETIEAAVTALRSEEGVDGVVCGQPAIDTLKVVEGGVIASTPDRSLFWTVQTPQVFRIDALRRAFDAAEREGFAGTDDASLVERVGGRVRCIDSPRDNLKVTVPEDLLPVCAILRDRMAKAEKGSL